MNNTPNTPHDHTNDPSAGENPLLTAFALGELDPQSDDYKTIAAQVAEDAALQAQVQAIQQLAGQLTQSYEQADSPGLDDAALTSLADASTTTQATAPLARIHPKPSLTRRLLPYAGVAACAALATSAVFIATQSGPNVPTPQGSATIADASEPTNPQDNLAGPLTVEHKLDQPITVKMERTWLAKALPEIAEQAGVSIQFDTQDPANVAGAYLLARVSFDITDIPAREVLEQALAQANTNFFGDQQLSYDLSDGVIHVDTRRQFKSQGVTPSGDVARIAASPSLIAKTRAQLERPATLVAEQKPFSEVLDDYASQIGTSIAVNWPAAELVGVDQDTLVAVKLSNVPARELLRFILDQVSADAFGDDKLGYRIAEGYIKISTLRDLKSDTETRIYDFNQLIAQRTIFTRFKGDLFAHLVKPNGRDDDFDGPFVAADGHALGPALLSDGRDLQIRDGNPGSIVYDIRDRTVQIPVFKNAPSFDLKGALPNTNSGGSLFGESGSGGLFGDDSESGEETERPKLTAEQYQDLASRQERVDQYIELIQTTVGDPDEWLDEESTLSEVAGKFVIKTTPENHEAIDRLMGLMKNQPEPMDDEQINAMAKEIIDDVEMGLIELQRRQAIRIIERERRERFAELTDNPFKLAEHEPLSTFSVDVDTASYTYGRRAILTGKTLPTPDSVRIEEWINYFDYAYTAPTVAPDALPNGRLTTAALKKLEAADNTFVPFATDVEVVQCPWTKGNQLVRIGIQAMDVAQDERPPAHLVFLLDVSGSMNSQDKLGLVQQGMPMLLDQLNDTDKVSIVVYAGASGLVLEAAEAADKNKIKEAIAQLTAGGSTAGGAGIQLAYDIADKHFVTGGINRVILCTDGDFNVGTSDTKSLVELVKAKANPQANDDEENKGVYLSVMGFGTGNLNDEMMEKITNAGNGNYHYIDSVNEAVKTMANQAGGTLVTVAKDVKLQLEFNPAKVASYRLIGYENRILRNEDFNNDTIDAGDIGAGHSVTALYEIVPTKPVAPTAEDEDPVIDELRYQKPRGLAAAAKLPELLTLKLRYKPVDAAAEQGTSRKVVKHVPAQAIEFARASEATRFTSSVAALGMILRGSQHQGNATTQWVIDTAKEAKTHDPNGYRNEFVQLATRVGLIQAERDDAFRKDLID